MDSSEIRTGGDGMADDASDSLRGRRLVAGLGSASVLMLLGAGGLLWWRDGDRQMFLRA
jgi:hypothetical protein